MIDKWATKKKLNRYFESLVKKYLFGRIKANTLTFIGLIFGIGCSILIFLSTFNPWTSLLIIFSSGLMFLSFLMDVLDGILARIEGSTIFGGIFDLFCDRTVEIMIILALVSTDPSSLLWPATISLSAIVLCITIFLSIGAAAESFNFSENEKLIYYSGGIMERSETFLFLILMNIFVSLRILIFWLFGILIFITTLQRLRHAYLLFYEKKK